MHTSVSIIIPCYNDGKYIREAVSSALSQTYPHIEIIIVDDYSTDPYTQTILSQLAQEGVTVIKTQSGKKGLPAARNTGIAQASGVYILPLDADDKIDASYAEKAAAVLAKHPDVTICTARVRLFGLHQKEWKQPDSDYANIVTEECKILSTSMFRRRDWERVGGYEERLTLGKEDMVFWLDLLKDGGRVVTLPEIYIHYRIKSNSMTAATAHSPAEDERQAAMYASRPEIFQAHVLNFMCLCARYRQEKARCACLFSWKLMAPVFRLEWFLRQKIKRLFGRA